MLHYAGSQWLWQDLLCCVLYKCRKETICVLMASKYNQEEGTKHFIGILLCLIHKKIVGPELMKNWEKKE